MILLLSALMAFAAAAEAQPAASKERDEPTPIGQALTLTFGATFFAQVNISTNGPVIDLSRLNREGFYKLELIELLLTSARSRKPLQELAARRRKGEALRSLAVSSGVDYDALYESALAIQEIVDRDYLPRFPERLARKEKDEP